MKNVEVYLGVWAMISRGYHGRGTIPDPPFVMKRSPSWIIRKITELERCGSYEVSLCRNRASHHHLRCTCCVPDTSTVFSKHDRSMHTSFWKLYPLKFWVLRDSRLLYCDRNSNIWNQSLGMGYAYPNILLILVNIHVESWMQSWKDDYG